jgi:glycosyltransferase involved in cell wall biosynthesis
VVTTLPHLTQVICVDDGSTDGTAALVARRFPQVSMLLLTSNSGKAAAVQAAAGMVRTSHVLLMDADLRNLAAAEIDCAIAATLANAEIDMIILRRVKAGMHARLSRGDVLFSGERIVKTADLLAALAANPSRYQIEIALNRYMLENGKRVVWMPSSARNTVKMHKHGPMRGLAGDVAMVKNMVDYAGVGAYLEQYLFFARETHRVAAQGLEIPG